MTKNNRSLTVVRVIKAPVQAVYRAWTNADQYSRWMSDEGAPAKTSEMDVRVGGKYRFEVYVESTGDLHITSGEYLEVIPNRKIVKTWIYSGSYRQFVGAATKVTVEFRELAPDATELTLTHENLWSDEYFEAVSAGWGQCLDRLATLPAAYE